MAQTIEDYQTALESSLSQGEKLTECNDNLKTKYVPKGDQIKAAVDPNNLKDQPDVPYDASYPYNNATVTPSGHVFELDDSPGSERIRLLHRTGTFQEVHPDGSKTEKIVNDHCQVIVKDNFVYVMGNHREYIDGDVKVIIMGNVKAQIDGDLDLTIKGDFNMDIEGIFAAKATNWSFVGPVSIAGILNVVQNIVCQSNLAVNQSISALIDLFVGRNATIVHNAHIQKSVGVGTSSPSGVEGDVFISNNLIADTDVLAGTAEISLVNHVHTEQGDGADVSPPK